MSVISEDGTLADGLSTALFVMGLEKGTDYWRENSGFEVVFVTNDDRIYVTKGIEGVFLSDYDFSIIEN